MLIKTGIFIKICSLNVKKKCSLFEDSLIKRIRMLLCGDPGARSVHKRLSRNSHAPLANYIKTQHISLNHRVYYSNNSFKCELFIFKRKKEILLSLVLFKGTHNSYTNLCQLQAIQEIHAHVADF